MASLLSKLFGQRAGPVERAPDTPSAAEWRSRGNAALGNGDLVTAVDCYRQAAVADPRDALARLNLGFALLEQGDVASAQAKLAEALALRQPGQDIVHEIHYLLSRVYRAQGDKVRAIDSCKAAVEALPAFAEPMEELAQLLGEAGRHEEALEWARRLHGTRPSPAAEALMVGELCLLGRHDEALPLLEGLLAREPHHPNAWGWRANAMLANGQLEGALEAFERMLALLGPTPDALNDTAVVLNRLGRHEEALRRLEQVLQLAPGHWGALFNRTTVLLDLVRVQAVIEAAHEGLSHYPEDANFHWHLAIAHLLLGNFGQGWQEHEWRWRSLAWGNKPPPPRFDQPVWEGQELRGRTLLVYTEQGLGDAIQFVRYIPWLAGRASRILLSLPQPLRTLAADLAPNCVLLKDEEPVPPFDFHCALMSIPAVLRAEENDIPRDVPYFQADAARQASWARRLEAAGASPQLKVGIAWSGNPKHANDRARSVALDSFRGLEVAGCRYVTLQPEVRESDRRALQAWGDALHFGEELHDFADTAALVQSLDLVISVDTSVAHLAGALGRPVWILLPHCPDWRWMLGRSDSPWYPTARLFRQPRTGDWAAVIETVRAELAGLVAQQLPMSCGVAGTAPLAVP